MIVPHSDQTFDMALRSSFWGWINNMKCMSQGRNPNFSFKKRETEQNNTK